MMLGFRDFLTEGAPAEEGAKLKHITHLEDRPIMHGSDGFDHATGSLMDTHRHLLSGRNNNKLTMKYDGSPSIVYGHHPETGKFFVASKSAFNKNPKLNYTPEDVEKNHGHAPGLVEKLKAGLEHLPKIAPKQGVYQGDVMFTKPDVQKNKDGSASFTPNTITYSTKGERAEAIKKSKVGVVTHTKYEGSTLSNMNATSNVNEGDFGNHPDVFHHTATYDASKVKYGKDLQDKFNENLTAAKNIHHSSTSKKMYAAIERHGGDSGHLATYINQTVRTGETPSSDGFKNHVSEQLKKKFDKIKTPAKKQEIMNDAGAQLAHIDKNKDHYDNLLKMHGHLQSAKNALVSAMESNEGNYAHSINGVASKPEGFVNNYTHNGVTEPTKFVNRAEFARQNLLKSRGAPKSDENHHVMAYGRMNPPTAGHEEVVKTIKDKAKEVGGGHTLILSHSHNTKDGKNPLDPETKLKHARNAFPGTNIEVASKEKPTVLQHAAALHAQGVTHLHFVGGSDRKPMYDLLKKYNGVAGAHGNYNFKDITFSSSGERDENAKGVAGISGTKLRELASSGKKEEFHSHLASGMKPEHKDALYNDLRKAMK
jgi:hypothetical protein